MPDLFNETLLGEFSFIINNEKETCFSAFKKKKYRSCLMQAISIFKTGERLKYSLTFQPCLIWEGEGEQARVFKD